MKFRYFLEFLIFQTCAWIVQLMTLKTVRAFGAFLGEFAYSILGFRRSVTRDNLRHAFPHLDGRDIDGIARKSFRSVGISLLEMMWFPRLNRARLHHVVQVENPELVSRTQKKGKGVLILTAHFGNWELLGQSLLDSTKSPIVLIVKKQSNLYIDRKINDWRTRLGIKVVPMEISVRESIRTLRAGNFIGIAADQAAAKESVLADFFGRPVPTFEGPAVLSLRTGAPILLGFALRREDGNYRVRFEEIPQKDLNRFSDENVAELTRRHVRRTESMIRQFPGQWMWMHKRWKHAGLEQPSTPGSTQQG